MKLSASMLAAVAASMASASASSSSSLAMSSNGLRNVLSKARRLDDRAQQGEQAVEDYIQGFSLQFLKCVGDEAIDDVQDDDDSSGQYGVVFFRMCPNQYCNNGGTCSGDGYADFAISMASYVGAYIEDQADNMQWDDNMDMDNFAGCNQYEIEGGDDGVSYYTGPTCMEDGSDIRIGLFQDYQCQYEAEESFESISNGATLPFSEGGLISTNCVACAEYEDDGNYDVKDICMDLYDLAPLKCESWEMRHYYWDYKTEIYRYGQDTTGCKNISFLTREPVRQASQVGEIFMLFFLVAISVGGGYYYTIWWSKSEYQ
jgi:hypothetical protein